MLFRVCSDLHLEAFLGSDISTLADQFLPPDPRDSASVLALAGDISSKPDQLVGFIACVERRFQHVYFVPGNHCYYKHDVRSWNETMDARFINELKNSTCATGSMCWDELEGQKIRIAFGTLWADGGHSLEEQAKVGQGLADFYLIQKDGRRFTVQDMMVWHKKQKAALVSFLRQEYDGKTIVITHHMPSYRLCHPRFGNEINGGFAADCDDILASDYAPDIWVHGHTHDQINRQLDRTRVVCNPRGYTREWETEFNKFGANPVFIDL